MAGKPQMHNVNERTDIELEMASKPRVEEYRGPRKR